SAALLAAVMLAGCTQSQAPASAPASSAARPSASASAASGATAEAPTPVTDDRAEPGLARYDGYGDMRFGMDEAAFRHAWQGDLAGQVDPAGGCSVLRPAWVKQPQRFGFLFEQGRFARYDVGTDKESAPGGGRVGMQAGQIRALYGDAVQVAPHKYEAGASVLRVAAPDGRGALVFETDAAGKVTRWRVGVPPAIDYVEGCG
ncbi:lectin, partial [Dyella sp.]|uniref:lectin n=1 Tax=Dyella sp. TaxID=1869338 RepID=UPI002D77BCE9